MSLSLEQVAQLPEQERQTVAMLQGLAASKAQPAPMMVTALSLVCDSIVCAQPSLSSASVAAVARVSDSLSPVVGGDVFGPPSPARGCQSLCMLRPVPSCPAAAPDVLASKSVVTVVWAPSLCLHPTCCATHRHDACRVRWTSDLLRKCSCAAATTRCETRRRLAAARPSFCLTVPRVPYTSIQVIVLCYAFILSKQYLAVGGHHCNGENTPALSS